MQTANDVPIVVYNGSNRTITVALGYEDSKNTVAGINAKLAASTVVHGM